MDFLLVELAADQTLDREQRVLRIGDRLAFGRSAHQDFAVLLIGDDGGRGACALGVFDNLGLAVFHDRNAGIGGAEIDADNFAHDGDFQREGWDAAAGW